MILTLCSKWFFLLRKEYESLNVCPINVKEEKIQHLVNDQFDLNNETGNEEHNELGGGIDCFDLLQGAVGQ